MAYSITEEFVWTKKRSDAALLLAQGYTNSEVGREIDVHRATVGNWLKQDDFAKEVDALSLTYGGASKAYRIRQLNKALRQKIDEDDGIDLDGVTFMDIIKELRMQTEGIRLGLLEKLIATDEETGPVAGSGSTGSPGLPEPKAEEAD